VSGAPVRVRDLRERIVQTLAFEALGVLLIAPLYGFVSGASGSESFKLIVALSVVVMAWSAAFNSAFDRFEARRKQRVASARPNSARLVHALGHELGATIVSWPVIVWMTGMGWWQALFADVALSLVYAAYAYLFHLGFDRLRPV